MRYRADITAGSLKLKESRVVAGLMIQGASTAEWRDALGRRNLLQVKNPATAVRLARLIRGRLETMKPELWQLIHGGSSIVATQAVPGLCDQAQRALGGFPRFGGCGSIPSFCQKPDEKALGQFLG